MCRPGVYIILALLVALLATGCHSPQRRILVIHSYEENYVGYPEYNHLLERSFRKAGINAEILYFYVDCERHDEKLEIERISKFLDSITDWQPEVILLNDDQGTYSALKTYHPLMRKTPIVFAGVNYPNWELIKEYPNATGFQDKIDYLANFNFITKLTGESLIHTVLDYTFLDKKIRADIQEQIKGTSIISNLDFHLDRKALNDTTHKGHLVVMAYSIRQTEKNWNDMQNSSSVGGNIMWSLSKFNTSPYLQTKLDFTTGTIATLGGNQRFSAINEMFGCGYSILAGYMTPLSTQVEDEVRVAVQILKGTPPDKIPITVHAKDYVMDWEVMQKEGIKRSDIPAEFQIIHIPFEAKYPLLWGLVVWGGTASLSVIFVFVILLYRREARKKREAVRALANKSKFLALAIKGSNTYAWRMENNMLIFEHAFWDAQHVTSQQLSLKEFARFLHPDYRHIIHLLNHISPQDGENRVELKCDFNGSGYRWWELRYSFVAETSGEKNITGLFLDIEEYKRREQELIEARELAEQAELKQSFLANMSHEIRTPLNAIVGFSNILANAEEPLEKEDQQQFVSLINSNSELLLKLINDILEISRIESGYMSFEYASHSLRPLIEEVYNTHQMLIPKQLEFLLDTDTRPLEIFVDKNRLIQVLSNFISNACKFTKAGYIKLGYTYLPERRQVEIYVEDSGIGIPQNEQKMIFSRFYKQNEFAQGTGLGLSICRVIIEKLNGKIHLTSEPGKGSRFSVFLNCEISNQ